MVLELNDQERDTLADALRSFLSDLRTEVTHTDRQAYRRRLKEEEKAIKQILGRLDQAAADEAAEGRGPDTVIALA